MEVAVMLKMMVQSLGNADLNASRKGRWLPGKVSTLLKDKNHLA